MDVPFRADGAVAGAQARSRRRRPARLPGVARGHGDDELAAPGARRHGRRGEDADTSAGSRRFADNQNQVRRGFLLVVGLNLFLVTLGGIFLGQESRRRRREAVDAKERNVQLRSGHQRTHGRAHGAVASTCSGCRKRRRRRSRGRSTMSSEERSRRPRSICSSLSDKLAGGDPQRARLAPRHGGDRRHHPGQAPDHRGPAPDAARQSRHRRRAQMAMQPVQQAIERALPRRDCRTRASGFLRLTASRSIASCRRR